MPQRNGTLKVGYQWVALSDGPVTNLTISNRGHYDIEIMASDNVPMDIGTPIGIMMERGVGVMNRLVMDMFPATGGGAAQVWVRCYPNSPDASSFVFVSHA